MTPAILQSSLAPAELIDRLSASARVREKLALLSGGVPENPVVFGHVAGAGQAFYTAALCRALMESQPSRRVWLACPNVKVQELIHAELDVWGVESRLLPEEDFPDLEGALPDPESAAERLAVLQALEDPSEKGEIVALCESSFGDSAPKPGSLRKQTLTLSTGDQLNLAELSKRLTKAGFEKAAQVYQRGQFAVRGGILDVFAWQSSAPVRIELFDEDIESIREFNVDDQVSFNRLETCELLLEAEPTGTGTGKVADYVGSEDFIVGIECEPASARVLVLSGPDPFTENETAEEDDSGGCFDNPLGTFDAGDFILQQTRRDSFIRQVNEWSTAGWLVSMGFNSEGEVERFAELVDSQSIADGVLIPLIGQINRGFTVPDARLAVLSDAEIFGRYQHQRARRILKRERQRRMGRAPADLKEYQESDRVVHADYGIGIFRGIVEKRASADAEPQEMLELEYAEESRLFVPLDQAHLVSRYVGVGKKAPKLDKLGGTRWGRTKKQAERSILDYAAQLLSVQAERQTDRGVVHEPDSKWQWEFENSFLYKETPDQISAIEDTKLDMESTRPMDRLICGDVGFGKTEVAIRAAFKAVMSGFQVAVLTPTTVLAQQHFQTFRERMSEYPVTIDMLSRYRSAAEQRKTVQSLSTGNVDIVVGTHRLISKDIVFKRLGLVVVDEEQRFGVKHKERFKELFRMVDVLTLSATPIPRTLYLSLMGARDMSTIETPPPNRIPVKTTVCGYDERVIRSAIDRELKRQGQVFFLHNRVKTIEGIKRKIETLCPGARVGIGHGQMDEDTLEEVMTRFINAELDVLVCTTIIESGVDIPNANTIIIDRADRFGLADLYQLRGRVGRADQRAYAILMLPRDMMTVGDARKRINAIKQYGSLGAGFKIAMRDLEIRGAGNLLGTQQSGHIAAVGFDLYCQLLKQSVARLKGETVGQRVDLPFHVDFLVTNEAAFLDGPSRSVPAYIPALYMPEASLRITAYRHVAEATSLKELRKLGTQWIDRFGRHPEPVRNLLICAEMKIRAANHGISSFEIKENKLMLTKRGKYLQINGRFPRLTRKTESEKLREALELLKIL